MNERINNLVYERFSRFELRPGDDERCMPSADKSRGWTASTRAPPDASWTNQTTTTSHQTRRSWTRHMEASSRLVSQTIIHDSYNNRASSLYEKRRRTDAGSACSLALTATAAAAAATPTADELHISRDFRSNSFYYSHNSDIRFTVGFFLEL